MAGSGLPLNVDSTYPDSSADPSIKAHQKAHDAVHRIVNRFDTALPTSTGSVLTWNGTTYAPARPASGAKAREDASRAIWAMAPSPESGLVAVAADAATDDAPRLQRMLNYVKATYGGGQLFLPSGRTSNCNSTITIPAGVQVIGSSTSVWDFWYAGSAVTAVIVNDQDFTPINGLKIHGNQWDANRTTHNTTTSTGIKVSGFGLNFVDVHVTGFNWGVDFTNDNTYCVSFQRSTVASCMVAINLDLANSWSSKSAARNSGERMTFSDGVIANCDTAYWATGNGVGLFFVHTSMDFLTTWGRQQDAHVFFDNCHLETTYSGRNRYMFDLSVNSRLYMSNCLFILGAAGVYHALNPDNAPWNRGWGMAHFANCSASYAPSPSASSAGAVNSSFSEALIPVPAGATSVVVASYFVSRWNAVKAAVVSTDGFPGTNVVAQVSAMSTADATVTITLSAPAPAGTWIEIDF